MNYSPDKTRRLTLPRMFAATGAAVCLITNAPAALVTQTGNDGFGESSFNTALHWSNALAPVAGNSYQSASVLRTPASSGSYTFQGDSLTLNSGGSLVYKGESSTDVITVNDLRLKTGSKVTGAQPNVRFTLAGSLSIDSGNVGNFVIGLGAAGFTVSSAISGAGGVRISTDNSSQTGQTVVFNHAGNSYSGGTTVQANSFLVSQADGALGTGNVTLTGGKITFELGTTNDYIADSARFIVAASLGAGSVTLNYSGFDLIAGLSLDGGATYLGGGSYSVSQLNTLYGSNLFTGTGGLTVVPEPTTAALLGGGLLIGLACGLRRKRRNEKSIRALQA